MAAEGHAVGNHSYSHPVLPKLDNPNLKREVENTQRLIEALADGTLDCIASAHVPQARSSKEQTFEHASSGMISLETVLPLSLELVRAKRLTASRLVELLSLAPARVLGLDDQIGSLKEGRFADFVLFDPKASFVFDPPRVHSAARNSPFFGRKMQGLVKASFVSGTPVFEEKNGAQGKGGHSGKPDGGRKERK